MAYQKQTWRDYDDTKTELQNVNNGAVVTPERLNHIENGIANSADKAEVTAQLQQTEQNLSSQLAQIPTQVNISDSQWGAVGDGVTDDTKAIQDALNFAVENGIPKIVADRKSYRINGTVFLPFGNHDEYMFDVDFSQARFIGNGYESDQVMFESGALINGVAESTWDSNSEQFVTRNVLLHSFTVEETYIAMQLKNWNYGCRVFDIFTENVAQIIYTRRCFYLDLSNILPRVYSSKTIRDGVALYRFSDNNNIMPMNGLKSARADITFQFDGATEAIRMINCGYEGVNTGVVLNGTVYNLTIDSGYFETTDIGVRSVGDIRRLKIENSWFYNPADRVGYVFSVESGAIGHFVFDDTNYVDNFLMFETRPNNVKGLIKRPTQHIGKNIKLTATEYNSRNNIPPSIMVNLPVSVFEPASGISGTFAQSNVSSLQMGIQSGRYMYGNGRIPLTEHEVVDDKMVFNTSIQHSDTQLVFFNCMLVHSQGSFIKSGLIHGNYFFPFDGVEGDITISKDEEGLLVVTTKTFPGGLGFSRGQIMLLA